MEKDERNPPKDSIPRLHNFELGMKLTTKIQDMSNNQVRFMHKFMKQDCSQIRLDVDKTIIAHRNYSCYGTKGLVLCPLSKTSDQKAGSIPTNT
jgi:hypothetical protein